VTDLSPEARAIIDAGRDGDSAGDLERARVRRALFAKLAAGGGAALASSSVAAAQGTAPVVAAATTALPLAKILVPLAILAAGSVGGTIAWHARGPAPTHAQPAVVLVAPAPTRIAAPPPALAPVVLERPAPRHAVAVSRPTTLVREAPVSTNRLAEETALLSSANSALRAGDSTRALALLDDYDHRYPGGVLREEVLATRIIARCELGGAAKNADADAFLARHPKSPLAPRVRSSCGR
jgi:hypothetical protein